MRVPPCPRPRSGTAGRRALGVLVVVALAVAACGGESAAPETQPAPDVTRFTSGDFEGIPRYPRSEPLSPRTEENGVVSRSFGATGATADAVLEWYDEHLAGWRRIGVVEAVGAADHRGTWVKDGRRLQVSAAPAPAVDGPLENVVQFSLVLGPEE